LEGREAEVGRDFLGVVYGGTEMWALGDKMRVIGMKRVNVNMCLLSYCRCNPFFSVLA
jgi:hypothetical protein